MEFALVLPVFALILFAVIQFGLAFGGWASVRASVQIAARMVAIDDPGPSLTTCPALTAAENYNAGYRPAPGQLTTSTKEMMCEVAYQIGSPVGTSSSTVPEIGLQVTSGGAGENGTITVCASVPTQPFTGFFPSVKLSTTSQFYIEDPAPKNDVIQSYNPYGFADCGS